MCLNGFNIPTHIWLRLYPVWLVVFGVTGSIPKCDAHLYIYIYILSENSVTIICLALRRSAINATGPAGPVFWQTRITFLDGLNSRNYNYMNIILYTANNPY